jgi:hypothetical protein
MRPEHVNNLLVTASYIKELEDNLEKTNRSLEIELMRTGMIMETIYDLSVKLVQHNYGSEYPTQTIGELKAHYNNWQKEKKT